GFVASDWEGSDPS
ncbi:hypothetical protein A2U01_0081421, partial [Trifolium medium]|nr:hypothetical protein [Trifolium medium]